MEQPSQDLERALAGRYRVLAELGQGGMATVYRAEDLRHHREVALKVMRPEVAAAVGRERFLLEIRVLAGLSHPHILPLLDSGETGGILWYTMPFVAGESLRQHLQRRARLPLGEALALAREVGGALTFAHRHQIIHRDIKPENILLHEGEAMVADFGIALVASAARNERLTSTGMSPGTLTYMSPEQLGGMSDVDGRSDQYALASVLFEMITGAPPVIGVTPTLRSVPELPSHVAQALRRALATDRDQRFPDMPSFLDGLGVAAPAESRSRLRMIALGVTLVVAGLAVVLPLRSRLARARAEASLPRIVELAAAGRSAEAFALAVSAERALGRDSVLDGLFLDVSDWLTVASVPEGAEVWLQAFQPDSAAAPYDSVRAGRTPIRDLRIARGDYRVVVRKDGYQAAERIASTEGVRVSLITRQRRPVSLSVRLHPLDSVPQGMVPVDGGRYELRSPDLPPGLVAELEPYFIDRTEVTNAAYRSFVRGDGYGIDSLWDIAGRGTLTDRTGLPGPRGWSGQDFPAGEAENPVAGVSWHEARAYCASRGGTLPTVYEWEKAARNGEINSSGTLMPWGLAGPGANRRANFQGPGTMPVNSYPFGISPWGTWGMAGNVKEWTSNAAGSGRVATGGSWQDPLYIYSEYGIIAAAGSSAALGFRCVRHTPGAAGDQGAAPLALELRTPVYRPVDDATFRGFLAFYRHDRQPLDARLLARSESADWVRERVRYRGVGSDSVIAYLYLPRHVSAPYQTLVYVPGGNVFFGDSVWYDTELLLAPLVRSGRAVLAPVLERMTERGRSGAAGLPDHRSVEFRDLMLRHSAEVARSLDFLASRPEIDSTRVVYVGLSFGAGSRLVLAGTDERFRGVIFIGAGIDERLQPTMPEASNINFAPRIRPPKLMINGRWDEEHPWYTRALPLWNLLREPKELVLIEDAGHIPGPEELIPPMKRWLDQLLGQVRR